MKFYDRETELSLMAYVDMQLHQTSLKYSKRAASKMLAALLHEQVDLTANI